MVDPEHLAAPDVKGIQAPLQIQAGGTTDVPIDGELIHIVDASDLVGAQLSCVG